MYAPIEKFSKIFLAGVLLITALVVPTSASRAGFRSLQPDALTPDPAIQQMLAAVDSDELSEIIADLSGVNSPVIGGEAYQFQTRYTLAAEPIAKATQYVYESLTALNLAVRYQPWNVAGTGVAGRNVIAEQAGNNTLSPCIYVVTAHVDSIAEGEDEDPMTRAPGADDDASGTAAVLILAKILNPYHFSCTIRYVITTGEEQGLYGSDAYAHAAATTHDPIQGAFALDMLAYKSNTSYKFEMISRPGASGIPDRLLTTMLTDVTTAYQIDLISVSDQSSEADADHASFWAAGFPAILVIQDTTNYNPYYHQYGDTLDKLNLAYDTKIVKAVLGALAHLAVRVENQNYLYMPLNMKHSLPTW